MIAGSMVEKPWGYELIEFVNDGLVVKKLIINDGHRTSLQYHERKTEVIHIASGTLELQMEDLHTYVGGGYVVIPPGMRHRLAAKGGTLTLIEVATNHYDDVVRIADDYGREDKKDG